MNVLIFSTGNLMGIARFPKTLCEAGFKVGLLCAPESFISKTRYVEQKRFLRKHKPSIALFSSLAKDLSNTIQELEPSLIIPGDERAVYCLHKIVRSTGTGRLKFISDRTLEVIKRSLCHPNFYEATNNKNVTQETAKRLGIRVPRQFAVCSRETAIDAARQLSYPLVLKKGIGEAGLGVRVCQTEEQLLDCLNLSLFRQASSYKRAIRKVLGREISWVPNNEALALQQYISGTPAIHCIAALNGKVLGGYTAIKECIHPHPTGQATRIRFIDQPEVADAVARFIAHTEYNGFGDFEFLIEDKTGLPYFLECNPRPSTMFHLGKTIGVDLGQAMFAALSYQSYAPSASIDDQQVIVLFPQEWRRDPQSSYLFSGLHDVPWDDPLLLEAYLQPS